MLPNLKKALVLLYSIDTLTSSVGRDDFSNESAFLGNINEVGLWLPISFRRYRTSLCASVATNVTDCSANCTSTPAMAGRNSSLLTAKMVLLIASDNTDAGMLTVEALSTTGIFGKSSAFSPLSLYLPSPALISIASVWVSTENATG